MSRKKPFEDAIPVSLEDILDARERRAATQKELLTTWQTPLICFTMNTPGEYKAFPLAQRGFEEGKKLLRQQLFASRFSLLHSQDNMDATGYTGFFLVAGKAADIKAATMALEDTHPLGRLFDMDVFDTDGAALHGDGHGRTERTCLICGGPVWECSRSRAHTAELLAKRSAAILQEYFDDLNADEIAKKATRALLTEVSITPKPGLVDRFDNGAHRDMDMFTFVDSACALIPYFRSLTWAAIRLKGSPSTALRALRYLGVKAEQDMLDATGGINTHKGAIFSLGLICMAIGMLYSEEQLIDANTVLERCALLAGDVETEMEGSCAVTHGTEIYRKYNLSGVRGEAARGFPTVREHALPVMRDALKGGLSVEQAGVVALLHLIAYAEDTCMMARSSLEVVQDIQSEVHIALQCSGSVQEVYEYAAELNTEFIDKNISPGGCADLLAVAVMLLSITSDNSNGVKNKV